MKRHMKSVLLVLFVISALFACKREDIVSEHSSTFTPTSITLDGGSSLDGEEGTIAVPENSKDKKSRIIRIGFRRFPAYQGVVGDPVFLLAGGPGGSYNERLDEGGRRQKNSVTLIDLFRQAGDVVLVDLRGVYLSTPNFLCDGLPDKSIKIAQKEDLLNAFQAIGAACRKKLISEGFDVDAYTPKAAASDIIQVADALGYQKIRLYGRSFGSHWGMVLAKYHSERVSQLILEGIEGLDHTYDDPIAVRETVERISAEAAEAWNGALGYKDPLALFDDLQKVSKEDNNNAFGLTPLEISGALISGSGYSLRSRAGMVRWLPATYQLAIGNVDGLLARRTIIASRLGLGWDEAATGLLDCASSLSAERQKRLQESSTRFVLSDFEAYGAVCHGWAVTPLEDEFRAAFSSSILTLLFAGTYDVSTPIENAKEAIQQFSQGHLTLIERGSHEALLEALLEKPELADTIVQWMGGGPPPPSRLTLPAISFEEPEIDK